MFQIVSVYRSSLPLDYLFYPLNFQDVLLVFLQDLNFRHLWSKSLSQIVFVYLLSLRLDYLFLYVIFCVHLLMFAFGISSAS